MEDILNPQPEEELPSEPKESWPEDDTVSPNLTIPEGSAPVEDPAEFIAEAARLTRIAEMNNGVLESARGFCELGKHFAQNGRHEEALDNFQIAYIYANELDESTEQQIILESINAGIRQSCEALGLVPEVAADLPIPGQTSGASLEQEVELSPQEPQPPLLAEGYSA